jgi:tetratricopeptide (TPR) repeat protein
MTADAAAALIGRDHEVQALTDLIGRGTQAGQVLVVVGDPGIGKSALLGAARETARAAGFLVLSAVGVESEAQLPFAGLHQILRPVLRSASGLPPLYATALQSAFGLAEGPTPELFQIALAAVSLLAAAAAQRPVAVLVDDVQWLDQQSQDVLTFIARRAEPYPIVVIGVVRTGHPSAFLTAGLPELVVHGVDESAADDILLTKAGVLNQADRLRIRREAQGNPLALLELPGAWAGSMSPPADWQQPPLSARLERAFAGRFAELPSVTRDGVLVAAVDPVNELDEILAAASELSGSASDAYVFGPAADVGLLRIDDGRVHFRHPLVRSGVLQSETLTRRQAAHAALAGVLAGDPYRRTWHRAQSIVGPDDQIADALEANAAVALSRGAVMSAIADLQRAAQLTGTSARRGHRLLVAAEHAFGLGRVDLVNQLVTAAARLDLSELDYARRQWLQEIFNDGVPGDATRVFELCMIAGRSAQAGDRDLALNLLLGAALRCWWADTGPAARARVVEVIGELTEAASDPRYIAALAVAEPVLECATVMDLLSQLVPDDLTDGDALRLLGMAAHAIGDPVRSVDFLDRSETLLREQGRLGLLSQVLSMQVIDRLQLGDWDGASAAAAEGERLARETAQPIWRTGTLVCDAMDNAFRGHTDQAFTYAAEVEMVASRQRLNDLLSCVQLARGVALSNAGQYEAAYPQLRRLFEPSDPSFHQRERFGAVMFLAEAAVEAGEQDDARRVIAGLEEVAASTPSPMLHVHLRYARAILAGDANGSQLYADLMSQDLTRWPWAKARAELAYGSWLRRQRRDAEAVGPLGSALAAFDRIGALVWADRARAEMTAALAAQPAAAGNHRRPGVAP